VSHRIWAKRMAEAHSVLSRPHAREGADGQAVVCPLLRGSSPTRGVAPKQHRGGGHASRRPLRRATLEHIKTQIGSLQFSAQYQQQPIPLEGNIIRRRWFSTYDLLPAASHQTRVVQSWDVAMTTGSRNDYSVCTAWLVNYENAYLLHVFRDRFEYPDLRRKVIALALEYNAKTVLIEDAGPGMNLVQDLRADPKKRW
jgi:hypothetical protein